MSDKTPYSCVLVSDFNLQNFAGFAANDRDFPNVGVRGEDGLDLTDIDAEALPLQVVLHEAADLGVVLDDEDVGA